MLMVRERKWQVCNAITEADGYQRPCFPRFNGVTHLGEAVNPF